MKDLYFNLFEKKIKQVLTKLNRPINTIISVLEDIFHQQKKNKNFN